MGGESAAGDRAQLLSDTHAPVFVRFVQHPLYIWLRYSEPAPQQSGRVGTRLVAFGPFGLNAFRCGTALVPCWPAFVSRVLCPLHKREETRESALGLSRALACRPLLLSLLFAA